MYGGELIIIDNKDENGGYLNSRIKYIQQLLQENNNYIWLNQYSSINNVTAHYESTAKEIFDSFDDIDYLFVGVGTSGTIMGCYEYIQRNNLSTKIIAVDAEGSVSFGLPASKRLIPGIGTSRKPELLNCNLFDEVIIVSEPETITTCHEVLSNYSLLVGGSTGSVLAAIKKHHNKITHNKKVVAISPDFGDKYLDTIYNINWLNNNFPNIKL